VNQRQDQKAVGARCDPVPVIRHGIVAGADRVHPDHPRAPRLQLADADLDGVRVMVLRHAEKNEELRALPVRGAELPEGAAHRVDARRRHVDRAEAAMRRVIGRAEALGPEARERLRLVAAGEEREPFGRRLAQGFQPVDRDLQRLVPGDFLEGTRSPRPHPAQGRAKPRGRRHLHDAGCPLGAEDAPVHGVVAVAVDIDDPAGFQVHVDAATAGAHVAGGLADLVRDTRRRFDPWLLKAHVVPRSRP